MNLPVLAAWLHDIGKFAQRAGEECSPPQHGDSSTAPAGCSSSQHELYTKYFIERILPMPPELEEKRALLADLAAPAQSDQTNGAAHAAIHKADCLAAGLAGQSGSGGGLALERLNSIFAKVRLGGIGLPADAPPLQYQLKPLGDGDAIFPVASGAAAPDYAGLWRQFKSGLEKIPLDLGVGAWQASLVSLLERYCWCVPAAVSSGVPGASLYDHAATTAAISQALLACPQEEEQFLLFGGDLSGIQAFIFGRPESAGKGAAKVLRARSFLLQAVTRSIWLALLTRLKLDACAKIMDAGGRFVLFLPDTREIRQELDRLEYEAEIWLLENFQGEVRLNFARLGLNGADLGKKQFARAFEKFNGLLETAKLRPFSRAFEAGKLPWLPVDYADYAKFGECDFCHSRPASGEVDGQPVCRQCLDLMELGKVLPATRFIAFSSGPQPDRSAISLFDNIGMDFYDKLPPATAARQALQILSIRDEPIFTVSPVAGHIPLVTGHDLQRWEEEGRLTHVDGRAFFMGEECEKRRPKTFAMLAQEARIPPKRQGAPWTCMPCLAICKADVDNLGLIFSMGFGEDFSLSSYAMLARMLNHFFSGHLIKVIERDYPNIYVVFAGGDDVFAIGPWSETIAFGQRMAEDFRRFCGNNPAISISAGMPLVKAGLPMRGMREEAETLLEKSKSYGDGAKNAVTIFGVSSH